MNLISFKLVTPEKTVLTKELVSLTCPTTLGQITILPNHIPLVATLIPGELHAKTSDQNDFYINITGGFVEIRANNQVIVLADAAEHHYEIDEKRAQEAIIRAKKAMEEKMLSEEEYAKVASSLQRSLARLNIVRKHAHRKQPSPSEGTFKE